RTIAEIPHYFSRDLRIVRIEQWKRLTRHVVLQCTVSSQDCLGRVLFGRGSEWWWPFQLRSRHDLELHPLLNQDVISRTQEVGDLRRILFRYQIAGLNLGLGGRDRAQS